MMVVVGQAFADGWRHGAVARVERAAAKSRERFH